MTSTQLPVLSGRAVAGGEAPGYRKGREWPQAGTRIKTQNPTVGGRSSLPDRALPSINLCPPPPSPPPPGPRSPAGETSPFCRPSPRGQPCVSSGTLSQRHPRWTQQMPDGCSPQEPPWLSQMAQPLRLLPESLTTFPETPSVHDMSASPPEWPAL